MTNERGDIIPNEAETTAVIFDADQKIDELAYGKWRDALASDQYEDSAEALDSLREYRAWRQEIDASKYKSFYNFCELAGVASKAEVSAEQRQLLKTAIAERLLPKIQQMTPRLADFYQSLVAQIDGTPYEPKYPEVKNKVESMIASGDFDDLVDPDVALEVKKNRIQTRMIGELDGWSALDRRDRRREEKPKNPPDNQSITPPEASDSSKPGMDEMERSKEGETPPAIWTITPAYGGYFKEQSFDTWDPATNTWRQSKYDYQDAWRSLMVAEDDLEIYSINTILYSGQSVRLPKSYTMDLVRPRGLSGYNIYRDQNGDYILFCDRNENPRQIPVEIIMQKIQPTTPPFSEESQNLSFDISGLSEETREKISDIANSEKTNLAKARTLASYTMRRLKYSNDSSFNQIYDTDPAGYIGAIDNHKKADCDVANTYFAALCSALNIPVRHVVGHMVKGKDSEGNSRITSGTGHAWSEVWDDIENTWVRIDATPAGDPQLQDEEREGGERPPGDYGDSEAVGPSEEYLAELEKKLAEHTEELSYTEAEREIAEKAGVDLKDARKIVREINEAEDTRLPDGRRITDLLAQMFSLIVESRKTAMPDYTGPLRRREGGDEIDDIVAHKIGILASETDPQSRRKPYEREHKEDVFGGFDIYFVGDKSGSMSETVGGEAKWRLQRKAELLFLGALYRFEQNLKRAWVQMTNPLSVRSQAISFRDSARIDVDKPLSGDFSPTDKVRLWKSLGNQGVGNGDVAALQMITRQIKEEIQEIERQGKKDDRLRIVIACSDGYPDNPAAVQSLAKHLGEMNALVVGIGLTETAAAVPTIFNTEYSRGELVPDIDRLPAVVAKYVIKAAISLFPERSKKSAEQIIASIIDKFK